MKEDRYTLDVLVTAPHWCIVDQSRDRSCDLGTRVYAESIYKEILNIKGKEHVKLFITDVKRGLCDTNRKGKCIARSKMMIALKKEIERQKNTRRSRFVLFDIHSFGQYETEEGYFGLPVGDTPDVVLLTLPYKTVTNVLFEKLRENKVYVKVVSGSKVNNIMLEATRAGGQAVLVEIHVPNKSLINVNRRIIQSIRETVQEM